MSCLDVSIERIYNVNKSCQVIVGNPPIDQGLKSPQFCALGLLDSLSEVGPSRVLVMPGRSINREVTSLFSTHLIHTQL